MFLPSVHAETDTEVLLQFIRENPLGILITGLKSSEQDFLQCTHVPWVLDVPEKSEDSNPRIRAHIAKQNPQVKAMIEAVDQKPPNVLELSEDVLVIFNGQHNHYVTPKFYTETKPDSGKVVPTWNYAAVQVYGKLSLYYDSKTPEAGTFIAQQIHDLSSHTEKSVMGYTGGDRPEAWTVDEAPERYVDLLKRNIVGIEIAVKKIQGKFKMSQEMRSGDREGVVKGFESMGTETGTAISELVKGRGELHDLKKAGN
ncbi:transcriptional regulator [Penicillium herquei]|nr:transcriptional regulator [Penicillium herquei]